MQEVQAIPDEAGAEVTWRRTPLPPNWGTIRSAVLARDPICMWGLLPDDGARYPACADDSTEADHMGDPNNHDMGALRGLCHSHHFKRSHSQAVAASARIRSVSARRRPPEPHPAYRKE